VDPLPESPQERIALALQAIRDEGVGFVEIFPAGKENSAEAHKPIVIVDMTDDASIVSQRTKAMGWYLFRALRALDRHGLSDFRVDGFLKSEPVPRDPAYDRDIVRGINSDKFYSAQRPDPSDDQRASRPLSQYERAFMFFASSAESETTIRGAMPTSAYVQYADIMAQSTAIYSPWVQAINQGTASYDADYQTVGCDGELPIPLHLLQSQLGTYLDVLRQLKRSREKDFDANIVESDPDVLVTFATAFPSIIDAYTKAGRTVYLVHPVDTPSSMSIDERISSVESAIKKLEMIRAQHPPQETQSVEVVQEEQIPTSASVPAPPNTALSEPVILELDVGDNPLRAAEEVVSPWRR
jgi:hypothetical protein